MNRYIENLKSFLKDQTPNYGYDDTNSLLEMIYYFYTVNNPIDNGRIRCQFWELDQILSKLTLDENNKMFMLVSQLCTDYERQAFLEGIHVGLRLFQEICEKEA